MSCQNDFLQCLSCAVQGHLNVRFADFHDFPDFLVGVFLDVAELEHCTLFFRQHVEHISEPLQPFVAFHFFVGLLVVVRNFAFQNFSSVAVVQQSGIFQRDVSSLPLGLPVKGKVAYHGQGISLEIFYFEECRCVAHFPYLHEHVLHDVLGLGAVECDAQCQSEERCLQG